MKQPFFTGVCTALVTPFANGKINYEMLEILLDRQIEAGIEAVVLSGTTGESATLSQEEKIALFRYAKHYVEGQCKIIAGTGSNATAQAVKLSQAAEDAGADYHYNIHQKQRRVSRYPRKAQGDRPQDGSPCP